MGTDADTSSVPDGKAIPQLQYRLTYDGVELTGVEHNHIAKRIFNCASYELAMVFSDKRLNLLVLAIFKGNEILGGVEVQCLEQLDITTVQWGIQFLKLLGDRYNTSEALQQLCNINDERNQLLNYQQEIHKALQNSRNKTLSRVKVVEIR
ncbi:unnamed protein product [Orchesella dallaii]|uniref:Uncharacterized protein n=1 Tax=Orchesella dallaii TaxID=48710 RepID=A0ABP1R5R9_9HEXA